MINGIRSAVAAITEAIGGAAAPLMIGLSVVIVLPLIAVGWYRLRPRRRVGYVMVPDPHHDSSSEEIVRWAAGLVAARSAIGWATNSHKMIRISFCSDPQGRLVSLVGMNPRARSVAERNGYSHVELVDPNLVFGPDPGPAWLASSSVDSDDGVGSGPLLDVLPALAAWQPTPATTEPPAAHTAAGRVVEPMTVSSPEDVGVESSTVVAVGGSERVRHSGAVAVDDQVDTTAILSMQDREWVSAL